jgi:transcriptional regulator with XRE-family HTH domain
MGLSQTEFAVLLDVGRQAYSAWESGKNTPASIPEIAERLETVTGVPRQWFLGWMDDAPQPDPTELPRLDSNQQPSGYSSAQVTDLWALSDRRAA